MPNIDMRTILHIAGELVLFAGVSYYFQVRTRILGSQVNELQKIVEAQNQSILILQQQVEMLMMRVNGVPMPAPLPVVTPQPVPQTLPVKIPIVKKAPKLVEIDSDEDIPEPPKKVVQASSSIEDLDKELAEELGELEASAKE